MQVTLIDFTLSRLVTVTGEVAFCDLAADPELFKGPKGSVQVRFCRDGFCACCGAYLSLAPSTIQAQPPGLPNAPSL